MKPTLKQLQTPANAKEILGQPMLFAKTLVAKLEEDKTKPETIGDARLAYNIMTGDWMVSGQKNSPPYFLDNIGNSISLMKSINIFNSTGQKSRFKNGSIKELCVEEPQEKKKESEQVPADW